MNHIGNRSRGGGRNMSRKPKSVNIDKIIKYHSNKKNEESKSNKALLRNRFRTIYTIHKSGINYTDQQTSKDLNEMQNNNPKIWFMTTSEKTKYSKAQYLNKNINYYLDELNIDYVKKLDTRFLNDRTIEMINEKYGIVFYTSDVKNSRKGKTYEFLLITKKGKFERTTEWKPNSNDIKSVTNYRTIFLLRHDTYYLNGEKIITGYENTHKGRWFNLDVYINQLEDKEQKIHLVTYEDEDVKTALDKYLRFNNLVTNDYKEFEYTDPIEDEIHDHDSYTYTHN